MKTIKQENDRFKITLPILKTRVSMIKKDNGEEVQERYISGVASNTSEDLVGDVMAATAIKSMADSLQKHMIELNAEHDKSWRSELGEVVELSVSDSNDLLFEGKLNNLSIAEDLWKALTEMNKQLGVSIGGYVKEYELEKNKEGEWIRVFKNIELDHIAITSAPANPKTWVNAISKSLKNTNQLIEELNDIEEEKSELSSEQAKERVITLLKSFNKEELTEDVINLIFKNESIMSKKETSLEAEDVKKNDESQVVEEGKQEETANPEAEEKVEDTQVEGESKDAPGEEVAEEESTTGEAEPTEEEPVKVENEEETKEEEEIEDETEKTLGTAYSLMGAADYLDYAIDVLQYHEKNTDTLQAALETIKQAAAEELMEPEEKSNREEQKDAINKSIDQLKTAAGSEEEQEEVSEVLAELVKSVQAKAEEKFQEEVKSIRDEFEAKFAELADKPAGRKGVEVVKGVGGSVDGDDVDTSDPKALEKKMQEEIDEVMTKNITGDSKYAKIQGIRRKYKEEYGLN